MKMNSYKIEPYADLHGADLHGADLHGADLHGANLCGADLYGANLYGANLCGADLHGADLRWADLHAANLCEANLRWANLRWADLRWTNLYGADLRETKGLHLFRITPDGAFLAYKKLASGEVATVNVPHEAQRVNAYGSRKIRVSMLRVEEVSGASNGKPRTGTYHAGLLYEPGAVLECADFDPDPRVECSRGLHVFLTREEAEEWP